MATALHGSGAGLMINGYDMTSFFRSFDIEQSQTIHDKTVFGETSRTKVPGLREGKISGEAFHDATDVVGSYVVLKGLFTGASPGTANPGSFAFAPAGFTLGNPVFMAYVQEAQFNEKAIIDDLTKIMISGEAEEDGIDFGVSLHAKSAETSFPVTGSSVDNTVATTNGGVGSVHVTAIAGADPNVVYKIQHATDNATWVDLITFAAITAANTVLRTEVAAGTTIRRYLRITITEGGTTTSVTGVVCFGRR